MKLKTKLSKLRHDGHITDAEYAVIINVLNKSATQPPKTQPCEACISRAEAIKEFQIYREYSSNRSNSDWVDRIETVLMHLPSVTPKGEPCEDYVSREAVIRLVEQYPNIIGNRFSGLIADIKHLPPVTPWSGWIPASQLPPSHEAVLLYVKYKSSSQRTYQLGMWNDNKQEWEDWRTPYRLEDDFEIIKWMELPEGYEEDRHE